MRESERILREQPRRVLGSRFVYRNKHAGMVSNGLPGNRTGGSEISLMPFFNETPREGIDGVKEGCIMHLKGPVYGLPDAPRAWYESLKQVLVKEF